MAKKEVKVDDNIKNIMVRMDNILEDLKDNEEQRSLLRETCIQKVNDLTEKFEERNISFESKRLHLENELRQLFEQVPQAETKTQRKVALISGDVVIKKPSIDFIHDDKKLLDFAKVNGLDCYIKEKTSESFSWEDFKNDIVINEGSILLQSTGELLEIEGLTTKAVPEKLVIK